MFIWLNTVDIRGERIDYCSLSSFEETSGGEVKAFERWANEHEGFGRRIRYQPEEY